MSLHAHSKDKSKAGALTKLTILLAATYFLGDAAHALSFGGLNVFSASNEPLRAEIEIVEKTPGEAEGVGLSVAGPDEYRSAGLDYKPIISKLRFEAYRKDDGRIFLKVLSNEPVNDKMFDLVMQAQAKDNTKLRRQYSFLLGTPTAKAAAIVSPQVAVAPALAQPAPPAPQPAPVAAPAPAAAAEQPKDFAEPDLRTGKFAIGEPKPELAGDGEVKVTRKSTKSKGSAKSAKGAVQVQPGDTLGAIARRYLPAGVSLEQMTVALFQANRDAFINDNLNLIRANRQIQIPDAQTASALSSSEVKETLQVHSENFNAYRQTLAGKTAAQSQQAKRQAASGKLKAEVSDAKASANSADKLKLSKATGKALTADEVAKKKQKEVDAAREAELKKNAEDLKKLQAAAGDGKSTAAGGAASVTTDASLPDAKTDSTNSGETGLWSKLWNDYKALLGLSALALLGLFWWFFRRNDEYHDPQINAEIKGNHEPVSNHDYDVKKNSKLDYAAPIAPIASKPANSPSTDPLAEAGVYISYGRYTEAEGVLKTALAHNFPNRIAANMLLAEIYAKSNQPQAFERLAEEIQNHTQGHGADWDRLVALSQSFPPGSFASVQKPSASVDEARDENVAGGHALASYDLSNLSLDLGDRPDAGLRVDMGNVHSGDILDKLNRAETLLAQGDSHRARQIAEELMHMDTGKLTERVQRLVSHLA